MKGIKGLVKTVQVKAIMEGEMLTVLWREEKEGRILILVNLRV